MARTNIEEEAWVRIYRLAELQGCSVREAAGTAACLWHQSQSLVKATGSLEEILEWASLHSISESESKKWISSLKKARLVNLKEKDVFSINGNEVQIESMITKISRASKGGQALKKKLRELKRLKAGLEPATRGLPGAPRGSNQCNSIQINAIQINAKKSKKESPFLIGLEQIYEKYPNKKGKAQGFATLTREIKTKEELSLFSVAVNNYVAEVKKLGREKQYILKFNNFVKQWRDYIEVDGEKEYKHPWLELEAKHQAANQ